MYQVPALPADAKSRYSVVTDVEEIAAIQRAGFTDPIGHQDGGVWYAERQSLAAYREHKLNGVTDQ